MTSRLAVVIKMLWGQTLVRTPHEHASCAGHSGAARGACKQQHAQLFVQFLDGARQRRLFKVQRHCRAAEMGFLREGQKTTPMAKFNQPISYLTDRS